MEDLWDGFSKNKGYDKIRTPKGLDGGVAKRVGAKYDDAADALKYSQLTKNKINAEEHTMKKTLTKQLDKSTESGKTLLQLRAGRTVNNKLVATLRKKKVGPAIVRGYYDEPMVQALIANAAAAALRHFMPSNDKAIVVADAMTLAAMDELMASFDIQGLFDSLVGGVDIDELIDAKED